jgi:phage terminase large subunit
LINANPNYEYLKERVPDQRVSLLQGSTRSGKTYSVVYYLIWLCRKYSQSGLEIDITRDTFTALKATAWKDFKDVLLAHDLYSDNNHNKTDHWYNLFGNRISYYGADNPDKIHGRSRDILWVNEAHQFPKETVDQLFPRTRHRIICDYNPALGVEHWLDPYIEQFPPLITTYQNNPHLTAAQVADIEGRKGDAYWWQVYGTGQRASREGVIFENWELGEFDWSLSYAYGLDFGYEPDPSALIVVAIDKKLKRIYLKEELYQTRLSSDGLRASIQSRVKRSKDMIVADSANKREIQDLRAAGLNVIPAKKGPGSIQTGLRAMLGYTLIIDPDSKNLVKELSNYVWNDRKSDTPVDEYNHLIDAARYAYTRLTLGKSSGVRKVN